jgi:hypothetical protein
MARGIIKARVERERTAARDVVDVCISQWFCLLRERDLGRE